MTLEQLQHARLAAWRQDGHALLTADDAAQWLRETGLALLFPRPQQIPAPAPSLVEALAGAADPAPGPGALEQGMRFVRRLAGAGDAVPLLLLPSPSLAGEQPDTLAGGEALAFVFALRGDREWGRGPRGKGSPLAAEVWKLLGRSGPRAANDIQHELGRQLTGSAILRALGELWGELRVEPVYREGEPAQWQLLEARHAEAMRAGAAMGQAQAVSALVSLYLRAAIAATGEEMEAFLGPLASRSRVREAVRGLLATRQLGVRSLGAREHFFVEGSLPPFLEEGETRRVAAPEMLAPPPAAAAVQDVVVEGEGGQRFRIEAMEEGETAGGPGEGRKRFVARRGGADPRAGYGREAPRKPSKPESGAPKPFFAREPWKEDRPAFKKRSTPEQGAGGARNFEKSAPGASRTGSDRKPFAASGERRSFGPGSSRPGGARPGGGVTPRPFGKAPNRGGERTPTEGRKPFAPFDRTAGRPAAGEQAGGKGGFRASGPRTGGERKAFGERRDGGAGPENRGGEQAGWKKRPFEGGQGQARKPWETRKTFPDRTQDRNPDRNQDRDPDRPAQARGANTGSGFLRSSPRPGGTEGERRPFGAGRNVEGGRPSFRGDGGERGPGKPFRGGEGAGRPPRPGGFKASGSPRREGVPGVGRPRSFAPESGEPEARRGAGPAARPGGKRPRTAPFTSTGKPRPGVAKPGRPGSKASRGGFAPPAKRGGKPGGKGPKRDGSAG